MLHCSNSKCKREYPIIDGVPILVGEIRRVIGEQQAALLSRDDLSPDIESLLGDALGPGSPMDALRQHRSAYGAGHYSDLDPDDGAPAPLLALVRAGLLLAPPGAGPWLDLGCAVGRGSFELAGQTDGLVLGVDLHFGLLRTAARALRAGTVTLPRRRVGLVYERRELPIDFPGADRVDFWMADALALPFPAGTFGYAQALNVLDCVHNPWLMVRGLGEALAPGGAAALCTPYDWSPATTPFEAWLGGHSQRGPSRGQGEPALRATLDPSHPSYAGAGLTMSAETELEWSLRLHDRAEMRYRVHMVAARR